MSADDYDRRCRIDRAWVLCVAFLFSPFLFLCNDKTQLAHLNDIQRPKACDAAPDGQVEAHLLGRHDALGNAGLDGSNYV